MAVAPNEQGLIDSEVFAGLVLDVPALLARDLATVLAQLQRAIGSAAHQALCGAIEFRLKRQS